MVQFISKKEFANLTQENHDNFESPPIKKRGTALKDFVLVKGNLPKYCRTDKRPEENIFFSDKQRISDHEDSAE